MFSKVFINSKNAYGRDIKKRVENILDQLGIEHVYENLHDIDLAILIGGDGTLFGNQSFLECPILGINPGHSIGFYMAADSRDFEKKVRRVLLGKEGKDFFIQKFPRLETKINRTKIPYTGMNDVLVSPIYVRRILDSELRVKGRKSIERNSGILVYTPGGSHAYARSAGAKPIKDQKRFGVVGIAPYCGRLKRRKITLSEGIVSIKCLNPEGEVCVDGQECQVTKINEGDVVSVKKSRSPVRIIAFEKNFSGRSHRKK
jgi:NAD kinase